MNHDDVEKLQLAGLGNEERFCRVEQSLRQRLVDARRDAEERATNQFGVSTSEFGEYDYAVSVSSNFYFATQLATIRTRSHLTPRRERNSGSRSGSKPLPRSKPR